MCGHCGCEGVGPIRQLMGEHTDLLDRSVAIRRAVDQGQLGLAQRTLADFIELLGAHVLREERGVFAALRAHGEYAEEVDALEGEHVDLGLLLDELGSPGHAAFADRFEGLVDELARHIEREDYGIFPVSVVTLGADGWRTVERAHDEVGTRG